jgi:hypothetical protein
MTLWNVGTGRSWANVANENSLKRKSRGHSRGSSPAKTRKSKSKNKNKEPEEGETKGHGALMKIYTRKPLVVGPGPPVRGMWVKAVDPEGDYGGPFANVAKLLDNPRYRSNMRNIEKNKARHTRSHSGRNKINLWRPHTRR